MKAILVGLGGRGRSWLNVCREHEDVEPVAYVEPAPANKQRAVKDWGVPEERIYDALEQAIDAHQADFVVDVTPPTAHEKVAMTAFQAGLHVIGEKPLSDGFAAGRRMVEAGRKAGVRHMITQNYRFGPVPRTTRRLMEEGVVGEPGQLDVSFYMPWADSPGSHYVTQPYMFLNDMGIHHFDMIRYVLGRDPASVQCVSWNLPWGWHQGDACHVAIFKFAGGPIATHHGIACSVGKRTTWNGEWRIEGPQGSLTWEDDKIFLTHQHRTDNKRREEIPHDELAHTGQMAVLVEFLSALAADRDPECSAADNLQSMAMVFAAVKSAQEGREVKLGELG